MSIQAHTIDTKQNICLTIPAQGQLKTAVKISIFPKKLLGKKKKHCHFWLQHVKYI